MSHKTTLVSRLFRYQW